MHVHSPSALRRIRLSVGLLVAVTVLGTSVGAGFMVAGLPHTVNAPGFAFPGFQGLFALLFATVSVPIALRKPTNPIGWMLLVAAALSAVQFAGRQYAVHGILAAPGSTPAPALGAWIDDWIWVPIVALTAIVTPLVFPDGRLPGPRWRIIAWITVLGTVVTTIAFAVVPELDSMPGVANPIWTVDPSLSVALLVAGLTMYVLAMAGAIGSLFIRFRRARGAARQQMKWLLFAGALATGWLLLLLPVIGRPDLRSFVEVPLALSIGGTGIAIGIAILRHRLYDIDLLINRALVYGGVTATLLAVYAGSVIGLQAVLSGFTGASTLAVAASTLTAAALFQPVRQRMQSAVDRRFYRSRYDAARTLDAFGTSLRHEVQVSRLTDDLRAVVGHALQPDSASVWLRRGEDRRS